MTILRQRWRVNYMLGIPDIALLWTSISKLLPTTEAVTSSVSFRMAVAGLRW
jgi:hypothetical protein